MCGIVGFWSQQQLEPGAQADITAMNDSLRHRGPDAGAVWLDHERGIAFGHRRLSIIDLSEAGNQPMVSASGRYVIVFNGEIYNHQDIRREVNKEHPGYTWRGTSDTESLLAAVELWGLKAALQRSVGMFGLALWDKADGHLHLARDRLGEKPLYHGLLGNRLVFASELHALRASRGFNARISRDALSLFFRHGFVPAPYTIYEGIHKLMPGTIATFRSPVESPDVSTYWSLRAAVPTDPANTFGGSYSDAVNKAESLLTQAVSGQCIADVPLGAFLSGGIDSSTVVSLMQASGSRPVRTFSIGFSEQAYNEAEHAKRVAEHLGTDHTELYVSPADAMRIIPEIPRIYDEPFSDSSQIPTTLVSRLAREHVTVSLSGDGGDELLGGYGRYAENNRYWRTHQAMPAILRKTVAAIGDGMPVPQGALNWLTSKLPEPAARKLIRIAHMRLVAARLLRCDDPRQFYRSSMSYWLPEDKLVPGAGDLRTIFSTTDMTPDTIGFSRWMQYADTLQYMPDDILVKVDRAAMNTSLETRVPLLDHRFVEFAWSLPDAYLARNGKSKSILRDILYKHVPPSIIDRPKMGFGVPTDEWLRGPLREWAEDLLNEAQMTQQGFLNATVVRNVWNDFQRGARHWRAHVWHVLMFQAWLKQQGN